MRLNTLSYKIEAIIHNVFPMVTNPEWIPARSIHNGNKYLIDLETYFQNGNGFYFIWIQFPIDLETYLNQMETVSILEIVFKLKENLCFYFSRHVGL